MSSTDWIRICVKSGKGIDLLPDEGLWNLAPGDTLRIGRGKENEITLADSQISRAHAAVAHDGEQWHYTSFGSNGSFVDGNSVSDLIIREDSSIQLAKADLFLKLELFQPVEELSATESCVMGTGSITQCLDGVFAGDEEAVSLLWAKCFSQICQMAKRHLGDSSKRIADEEDVAASVFESLFFGVADGRFPDLSDRDNLWRLVTVMTRRKAADYIRRENCQKRGGGRVSGDSIFLGECADVDSSGFDQFVADMPTPMRIAELDEQIGDLLEMLPDDESREIVIARMQGFSTTEIAEQLSISDRTIRRRLETIRVLWSELAALASH